ncbi:GNAT family N-acetyltransferase [Pseudomonas sp. NPDC090755]|uniref:GNAT family N-acetyltransferase n=1 Tax=Pseudomonas sp. NPDC090755 TaxID=3364481 RepID=UPI00383B9CCB
MTFTLRPARPDDAERLPAIEQSAAQAFLACPGLEWIARDSGLSARQHQTYIAQGWEWLVVDEQDRPWGFICGQDCGEHWHIVELSVHRAQQGQGLGRQLIQRVGDWAREQGYAGLTLTTFATVPWNAPFYARLGFEALGEHQLGDFLQRQLAAEQAHGLSGRCAMRLEFQPLS